MAASSCGPDGADYPMTAIFQEVVAPVRLVFICYVPDKEKSLFEILNTVTFAEQSGKTKLTSRRKSRQIGARGRPHARRGWKGWTQSFGISREAFMRPEDFGVE